MSENLDAALTWAGEQPTPGSFVDLGAYHGSPEAIALVGAGWRGIFVDAAPDAAAVLGKLETRGLATVFCGAVTASGRKLLPCNWTPDRPYTGVDRAAAASDIPVRQIAVPGLHPSELVELWPELPQPRFLICDTGPGSLELAELLCDWVPIDALRLTVPGSEAGAAAQWLTGWHGLAANELADGTVSFTARRPTAAQTIFGQPDDGPHPPSSSVPV